MAKFASKGWVRRAIVGLLGGLYGLTASVVSSVINTVVSGKLIVRDPTGVAGTDQLEFIFSASGGSATVHTPRASNGIWVFSTARAANANYYFQFSTATQNLWILGDATTRTMSGTVVGWSSSSTNAAIALDTGVFRSNVAVTGFCGSSASVAGGYSAPANTPAQITANTDNYSPGVGLNQRWSSDASRNVTGMVAGVAGETRYIWNVGAQDIVFKHQVTSTAANQFLCSTGADITLTANKCVLAMYDATTARWRVTLLP